MSCSIAYAGYLPSALPVRALAALQCGADLSTAVLEIPNDVSRPGASAASVLRVLLLLQKSACRMQKTMLT